MDEDRYDARRETPRPPPRCDHLYKTLMLPVQLSSNIIADAEYTVNNCWESRAGVGVRVEVVIVAEVVVVL